MQASAILDSKQILLDELNQLLCRKVFAVHVY